MPPTRLDCIDPPKVQLKVGDVLMVHRRLKDKETGKPFTWKWLGAVRRLHSFSRAVSLIRFGAPEGKDLITVYFHSVDHDDEGVWLIPQEEWPDGVWAFRTKLILEGRLDDAVLG